VGIIFNHYFYAGHGKCTLNGDVSGLINMTRFEAAKGPTLARNKPSGDMPHVLLSSTAYRNGVPWFDHDIVGPAGPGSHAPLEPSEVKDHDEFESQAPEANE